MLRLGRGLWAWQTIFPISAFRVLFLFSLVFCRLENKGASPFFTVYTALAVVHIKRTELTSTLYLSSTHIF